MEIKSLDLNSLPHEYRDNYFVLDIENDPYALFIMEAYKSACESDNNSLDKKFVSKYDNLVIRNFLSTQYNPDWVRDDYKKRYKAIAKFIDNLTDRLNKCGYPADFQLDIVQDFKEHLRKSFKLMIFQHLKEKFAKEIFKILNDIPENEEF